MVLTTLLWLQVHMQWTWSIGDNSIIGTTRHRQLDTDNSNQETIRPWCQMEFMWQLDTDNTLSIMLRSGSSFFAEKRLITNTHVMKFNLNAKTVSTKQLDPCDIMDPSLNRRYLCTYCTIRAQMWSSILQKNHISWPQKIFSQSFHHLNDLQLCYISFTDMTSIWHLLPVKTGSLIEKIFWSLFRHDTYMYMYVHRGYIGLSNLANYNLTACCTIQCFASHWTDGMRQVRVRNTLKLEYNGKILRCAPWKLNTALINHKRYIRTEFLKI